uniref:MAM domain-containing protein n=2 Tax=Eptatretus burgeri TaxID=7764 RepID=A0A8C4QPG7_EPTBU
MLSLIYTYKMFSLSFIIYCCSLSHTIPVASSTLSDLGSGEHIPLMFVSKIQSGGALESSGGGVHQSTERPYWEGSTSATNNRWTLSEQTSGLGGQQNTLQQTSIPEVKPVETSPMTSGYGHCAFKHSMCGYHSEGIGGYQWSLHGSFVAVEKTSGPPQVTARLVSPHMSRSAHTCVQVVYRTLSHWDSTLRVFLHPDNNLIEAPAWVSRVRDDGWHFGSFDVEADSESFQIIFEASLGSGFSSISIGQIKLSDEHCIACTFEEEHLCGYENEEEGDTLWVVHRTSLHRLGRFMTLARHGNNQLGDMAYISSLPARLPASGCLSFLYLLEGGPEERLAVLVRQSQGSVQEVWHKTGAEKNDKHIWREAAVQLEISQAFQIIFEGTLSSTMKGFVAFDDVSFERSSCSQNNQSDFIKSLASCDFEDGFCHFLQGDSQDMWQRVSVAPNSIPRGDHTTGKGYFLQAHLQADVSKRLVAHLTSPPLPARREYCLRFYYVLSSTWSGHTALYLLQKESNNERPKMVWSWTKQSLNSWLQAELNLHSEHTHQIIFVYKCHGLLYCGIAALDDITATAGNCIDSTIKGTSLEHMYHDVGA